MGITGLLPLMGPASRPARVSEWAGCTVAVDTYCWLHRGAFAAAEKIARGDHTDLHIKYCLKYVSMLLSHNIKPILVFDGRHLPAKAATEAKRRESRDIAKKRAAELLRLGQIEEARSFMRRSVDITHKMALCLIQECRRRNVDCIVAPYEADAQLAYLNIKNIAQLVITEDSDLVLFGCTKVLFKMDLEGKGTLVEASRLPLVMKCPIERYSLDRFRQMCIMSGCDYLSSLPGIGLAKARQFVVATQDPDFANALKKLPSFFNKSQLVVTDEYRECFLKAEATFKHQYVYDPLRREMVRLLEPEDEGTELALCTNAGELLEPETAFQLALGNLDPFSLEKLDGWHPDRSGRTDGRTQSQSWNEPAAEHPSIWEESFTEHLREQTPWRKKSVKAEEPIIARPTVRPRKMVTLVRKVVPETQDESVTMESLKNMYCFESTTKKLKFNEENTTPTNQPVKCRNPFTKSASASRDATEEVLMTDNSETAMEIDDSEPQKETSPILEIKNRCYKKTIAKSSYSVLKRLSKFPRTFLDDNVVESKFFNIQNNVETETSDYSEAEGPFSNSQKENSPQKTRPKVEALSPKDSSLNINSNSPEKSEDNKSPILESKHLRNRNPFKVKPRDELTRLEVPLSEDSAIDNTYPMDTLITPVESQKTFSDPSVYCGADWKCSDSKPPVVSQPAGSSAACRKATCKAPGSRKRQSAPVLPANQPTLLSKFGFHKKSMLKR